MIDCVSCLLITAILPPLICLDVQVAKMTVLHHSKPGTEEDNEGDDDQEGPGNVIDPDDDVYEVEILFKTLGQRKRLDVTIRIINNEEDEELNVYSSVIKVKPETVCIFVFLFEFDTVSKSN